MLMSLVRFCAAAALWPTRGCESYVPHAAEKSNCLATFSTYMLSKGNCRHIESWRLGVISKTCGITWLVRRHAGTRGIRAMIRNGDVRSQKERGAAAQRRARTIALVALPVLAMIAAPVRAKDPTTEAIIEVGKTLKGTIDSTAKAVDAAVTSTLDGKPSKAKKRKAAKKNKSDDQIDADAAKKPAATDANGDVGTRDTNVAGDDDSAVDRKAKKKNAPGTAEAVKPALVDKNPVSEQVDDTAVKAPVKAAAPNSEPKKSFPRTLEEAKAEDAAIAKPPETWSETEIAEGRARCSEILKRIHAVAIPETPIREGACGAPAPIQLISIGQNPEVSISPPATLTCEMAEKLAGWLEGDLQPLAKKHLGAPVIKIETMSSYSCRNAYGRANNKLSEHGIANALDIRGFVTASAKSAMVLEDWGTPQREILARIAAEKAKAEKLAAEKAAQDAKASTASQASDGHAVESAADADNAPKGAASGLSLNDASHLGGPRLAAASTTKAIVDIEIAIPGIKAPPPGPRQFLHEAHTAACQIFGTTLGPEANAAHRNHFHVDMAKRKSATTKICD